MPIFSLLSTLVYNDLDYILFIICRCSFRGKEVEGFGILCCNLKNLDNNLNKIKDLRYIKHKGWIRYRNLKSQNHFLKLQSYNDVPCIQSLGLAPINMILLPPNLYDSGWLLDCGMGRGRITYFIESQRLLGIYFENRLCIPLGYLNASKTI